MKKDRQLKKVSPLLISSLALLTFSMLGIPVDHKANKILNPLSPESEVSPALPEEIPVPVKPEPEEKKTNTSIVVPEIKKMEQMKEDKESTPIPVDSKVKSKKKVFFAPDNPIALDHEQKAKILDGDESTSTTTGQILSTMSGRLLFGTRSSTEIG